MSVDIRVAGGTGGIGFIYSDVYLSLRRGLGRKRLWSNSFLLLSASGLSACFSSGDLTSGGDSVIIPDASPAVIETHMGSTGTTLQLPSDPKDAQGNDVTYHYTVTLADPVANGDGMATTTIAATGAIDADTGLPTPTNPLEGDTLININNLTGADGKDTFTGNMSDNKLSGMGGDDKLNGGGGDDTLTGGDGADTLIGGMGNDILIGGDGSYDDMGNFVGGDVIIGGDGTDTVSYADGASGTVGVSVDIGFPDPAAPGMRLNELGVPTAPGVGGDAEGDTFSGIENIIGSTENDSLRGNTLDNVLDGGAGGNDTLRGEDGNDTLMGGNGIDTLYGMKGDDTLTGGTQGDVFVVSVGNDTITDWGTGDDSLNFQDLTHLNLQSQLSIGSDSKNNLRITFDDKTVDSDSSNDGSSITFEGVTDTRVVEQALSDAGLNFRPVVTSPDAIGAPENSTAVFHTVGVEDLDDESFVFTLSGTHAALFSLDTATGALSFVAEQTNTPGSPPTEYDLTVVVNDGDENSEAHALMVTLGAMNTPPTISGDNSARVNVLEGSPSAAVFHSIVATDAETPSSLIYAIVGGADSGLFAINSSNGAINFRNAADYESPRGGSSDNSNTYDLIVSASDGSLADTQTLAINVTDDASDNVGPGGNSAPVIGTPVGSLNVTVGSTSSFFDVSSLSATDVDGDSLTYSLGGADSALFSFDSASGMLSVESDTAMGAYDIEIVISDGNGGSVSQPIAISVDLVRPKEALQGVVGTHYVGSVYNEYLIDASLMGADLEINLNEDLVVIEGGLSDDTFSDFRHVDGGRGDDRFYGGDADNELSGGRGNDFLEGGDGADILDGGDGIDTASYASIYRIFFRHAVEESNAAGADANIIYVETFTIERDRMITKDVTDGLGFAPDRSFTRFSGTDFSARDYGFLTKVLTTEEGGGRKVTDAGLAILMNTDGVTVTLADDGSASAISGRHADGDTLVGIENLHGSLYDDVFTGNAGVNVLSGSRGDDTLNGAGGNDRLFGGGGDDTLNGGADNDVLEGGGGADTIDGGAGIDIVSYLGSNGGVNITLGDDAGTATIVAGEDTHSTSYDYTFSTNVTDDTTSTTTSTMTDTVTNVEGVAGSAFDDILTGNTGDNILEGWEGDDVLDGKNGNDLLTGDEGADVFKVSLGTDTITDFGYVDLDSYDFINLDGHGANGDDVLVGALRKQTDELDFSNLMTETTTVTGTDTMTVTTGITDRGDITVGVQDGKLAFSFDGDNNTATANDVIVFSDVSASASTARGLAERILDMSDLKVPSGTPGITSASFAYANENSAASFYQIRVDGLDANEGFNNRIDLDFLPFDNEYSYTTEQVTQTVTTNNEEKEIVFTRVANLDQSTMGDPNSEVGISGVIIAVDSNGDGTAETTTPHTAISVTNQVVDSSGNVITNVDLQHTGTTVKEVVYNDGTTDQTATFTAGVSELENITGASTTTISAVTSGINDVTVVGTPVVTTETSLEQEIRLEYSIVGGADSALFEVDTGGSVSFKDALDYEDKVDADSNGIYEVQIEVDSVVFGYTETATITTSTITVVDDHTYAFGNFGNFPATDTQTLTTTTTVTDNIPDNSVVLTITDDGGTMSTTTSTANVTDSTMAGTVTFTVTDTAGDSAFFNLAVTVRDVDEGGLFNPSNLVATSATETHLGSSSNGYTVRADNSQRGGAEESADLAVDLSGGASGAETITGSGGSFDGDTFDGIRNLVGGAGADKFMGGSEANYFEGGAGNDFLKGRAGADRIDGGIGSDTASYAGSADRVIIRLGDYIDVRNNYANGGDAVGDVLTNIENVIGTAGDDILIGNSEDNKFEGGAGADYIDGGAGSDWVSYISSIASSGSTGVIIGLADNGAGQVISGRADAAGDTLISIENIEGSNFDDFLDGNNLANSLFGAGGDDTLDGNEGDDFIFGGAGDDKLTGGSGLDTFVASLGTDTIVDYVSSQDSLNFGPMENINSLADVTVGVSSAGKLQISFDGDNDSTTLNDVVIFGDVAATTADADELARSILYSTNLPISAVTSMGADGDILVDGIVRHVSEVATAAMTTHTGTEATGYTVEAMADDVSDANPPDLVVDLSGGASGTETVTGTGGSFDGDTFVDVLNLVGGNGDDTFTGDANSNRLVGGFGSDTLNGGAGNDILIGSPDTNIATETMTSTMVTGTVTTTTTATSTYSFTVDDELNGGAGNDILEGGAGNDTLDGETGMDYLHGGAGNDKLTGGADADVFVASRGADVITDFVSGVDTISFTEFAHIDSIDDFALSMSSGSLSLVFANSEGGPMSNSIVLTGVTGGTSSANLAAFTALYEADAFSFVGNFNTVSSRPSGTASGSFTGTESNEAFTGGNMSDDVLTGGAGNDRLSGAGGDDTLRGDVGNDTLNGDAGVDILYGGVGNDVLSGGADDDIMSGGIGDDKLDGGLGVDRLDGGAGQDILTGGGGLDVFLASSGRDTATDFLTTSFTFTYNVTDAVLDSNSVTITEATTATTTVTVAEGDEFSFENFIHIHGKEDITLRATSGNKDSADNGNLVIWFDADLSDNGSFSASDIINDVNRQDRIVFSGVSGLAADADIAGLTDAEEIRKAHAAARHDLVDDLIGIGDLVFSVPYESSSDAIVATTTAEMHFGTSANGYTVSAESSTTSVNIDLSDGSAGVGGDFAGDTFIDIRNIIGSSGDDVLRGDSGDNVLEGGEGADTYVVSGGHDTIISSIDSGDKILFERDLNDVFLHLRADITADERLRIYWNNDEDDLSLGTSSIIFANTSHEMATVVDAFRALKKWLEGSDPTIVSANTRPVITLPSGAFTVDSDETDSFYVVNASDADGDALSYRLMGTDADFFKLNYSGVGGKDVSISLRGELDLDYQPSANGDNIYSLILRASDGFGGAVDAAFGVTAVRDIEFTNTDNTQLPYGVDVLYAADEVSDVSFTIGVSDLASVSSFTISGADAKFFKIEGNVLSVNALLDYENPLDSDGDNGYHIDITAVGTGKSVGLTETASYRIQVVDVADASENAVGPIVAETAVETHEGSVFNEYAVSSANSAASDTLTITLPVAGGTSLGTGGVFQGDTFDGILNLVGGAGVDKFTGSPLDNRLDGAGGDDTLIGGAGDDVLLGGADNDTLIGDADDDTLDGGAGTDTLTGGDGNDILMGGDGADTLMGEADDDMLYGGAGDDKLTGGAGNNILDGGVDNDTLIGGAGNDTFVVSLGTDTITGGFVPGDLISFAGLDSVTSESDVTIGVTGGRLSLSFDGDGNTATANDILVIDAIAVSTLALANQFFQSNIVDLDHIEYTRPSMASSAVETHMGTANNEFAVAAMSGESEGLTVNLADGSVGVGGSFAGDTFDSSITGLVGGSGDDIFTGRDDEANSFDGGSGDDVLYGGSGDNVLTGGAGNNILYGGDGDDTSANGAGNDVFMVSLGTDTITGGFLGPDVISFAGIASVTSESDLTFGVTSGKLSLSFDGDGNTATANDILVIDAIAVSTVALANQFFQSNIVALGHIDYTGPSRALSAVETHMGTVKNEFAVAAMHGDSADLTVNLADGSVGVGGSFAGDTFDASITGLIGGTGDDVFVGRDNEDNFFDGGSGTDTLTGGDGTGVDTVSYESSDAGVTIHLGVSGDNSALSTGGDAADDTFTGIENLIGSNFNDTLRSLVDAGDNVFRGLAGNDFLTGGIGNDTLYGGSGNDTLDGDSNDDILYGGAGSDRLRGGNNDDILEGGSGATDMINGGNGIDTASYASDTDGVTITLNADSAMAATIGGMGHDAVGDVITNIENLRGGSGDDTFTGNGSVNILDGGAGDDTLTGGAGADTFVGSAGADTITDFGTGSDRLDLSDIAGITEEANLTIGSDGTNLTLTYDADGSGAGTETASITFTNISATDSATALTTFSLTLQSNIDYAPPAPDFAGTAGDDTFTGTMSDELINGLGGNDELRGEAGNDTINGGDGNDIIHGGVDTNTLNGGANDDTFISAGGTDTIDGGAGIDTVSYAGSGTDNPSSSDISITLSDGGAIASIVSGGYAAGDVITNIENLIGGSANDVFTGNMSDNKFEGGDGNDRLNGGAGDDILLGGDGDDRLIGGAGTDTIDGGIGADSAVFSAGTVALTIVLNGSSAATITGGTDAASDILTNVESIIGVSLASNTLTGDGMNNSLTGGDLDDILTGGAGNDLFDGRGGTNTITGGEGNDLVSYGGTGAGITVMLNSGGSATVTGTNLGTAFTDTLSGIESVIGGFASDVFGANAEVNKFDGGLGDDTVIYSLDTAGVTVTLSEGTETATVSGGHAAGDELIVIENLTGGMGDDKLTGNTGDNILDGGAGDDTLDGGAGNDTLDGGADNDTVDYSDALSGVSLALGVDGGTESFATIIIEQDATTTVTVTDSISNIENIVGSDFADELTGNAGSNILDGGAGDDILDGGAGNNTLTGGTGADTFVVSSGTDNITDFATGDVLDFSDVGVVTKDGLVVTAITGGHSISFNGGNDVIMVTTTLSEEALFMGAEFAVNMVVGTVANEPQEGTDGADIFVVYAGGDNSIVSFNVDEGDMISFAENYQTFSSTNVEPNYDPSSTPPSLFVGDFIDAISAVVGFRLDNIPAANQPEADAAFIKDDDTSDEIPSIRDSIIYATQIVGTTGDDTLIGTIKNDHEQFSGGAGNDLLRGGGGNDTLNGEGGNDTIFGGTGTDTLHGGADNDTLDGGAGNDTLTGGAGTDTFVISSGSGTDIISDFVLADDRLDFKGVDSVTAVGDLNAGFTADSKFQITFDSDGDGTADDVIIFSDMGAVDQDAADTALTNLVASIDFLQGV